MKGWGETLIEHRTAGSGSLRSVVVITAPYVFEQEGLHPRAYRVNVKFTPESIPSGDCGLLELRRRVEKFKQDSCGAIRVIDWPESAFYAIFDDLGDTANLPRYHGQTGT